MAGGRVSTNNFSVSDWIVDSGGIQNGATHSTISSALSSASSGDTIFIRPGTYTENLTGKDRVTITAMKGDAWISNVTIVGKISLSSGAMHFANTRHQTNSDYIAEISGTGSVKFDGCIIEGTNNTIFSNSGSGSITLDRCSMSTSTIGITPFTNTGSGAISINYCQGFNNGLSVTPSTVSSGLVYIFYSGFGWPLSSSSTGGINSVYSRLNASNLDVTAVAAAGTGSHIFEKCRISSGDATTITVGAGVNLLLWGSQMLTLTSGSDLISGAGILYYDTITQTGFNKAISVTTQIKSPFYTGAMTGTSLALTSGITAYGVLTGGTTATGNVQSIVSAGTSGQVLTSNGASALPTFQAAATGGGAGYPFGDYNNSGAMFYLGYPTDDLTTRSTGPTTGNRFNCYPITFGKDVTVNQLVIFITSTAATICRMGIYSSTNGLPDALLLDSDTLAINTTGSKWKDVSVALSAGVQYWIGMTANNTYTQRAYNSTNVIFESEFFKTARFYKDSVLPANPLPNPLGTVTAQRYATDIFPTSILMRVA